MLQKYTEHIVQIQDDAPEQVQEVLKDFQHFIELFTNRSKEYGNHAFVLGARGQFADISRKMGKMRTAIWDGQPEKLKGEDIYEVMNDLIGHCFLTLQCLRKEGFAEKPIKGVVQHKKLIEMLTPMTSKKLEIKDIQDPDAKCSLVVDGSITDKGDPDKLVSDLADRMMHKHGISESNDAPVIPNDCRPVAVPLDPEAALGILQMEMDQINMALRNKRYEEQQKGMK